MSTTHGTHLTVQRKVRFPVIKTIAKHAWPGMEVYCGPISSKNTVSPGTTRYGFCIFSRFAHVPRPDVWDIYEFVVLIQDRRHDTVSTIVHRPNADACPLCDIVWSTGVAVVPYTIQKYSELYRNR